MPGDTSYYEIGENKWKPLRRELLKFTKERLSWTTFRFKPQ